MSENASENSALNTLDQGILSLDPGHTLEQNSMLASEAEEYVMKSLYLGQQPWFCCRAYYVGRFKVLDANTHTLAALSARLSNSIRRIKHKTYVTCSVRGIHIGGKVSSREHVQLTTVVSKRSPNIFVDACSIVQCSHPVLQHNRLSYEAQRQDRTALVVSDAGVDLNVDVFRFSYPRLAHSFLQMADDVTRTRRERFSERDRIWYSLCSGASLTESRQAGRREASDAYSTRISEQETENRVLREDIACLKEEVKLLKALLGENTSENEHSTSQQNEEGVSSSGPRREENLALPGAAVVSPSEPLHADEHVRLERDVIGSSTEASLASSNVTESQCQSAEEGKSSPQL